MPYGSLGLTHAAAGAVAIVLGWWLFATPKGTRRHVRVGGFYVASMVYADVTALSIRHLTGRINLFHEGVCFSEQHDRGMDDFTHVQTAPHRLDSRANNSCALPLLRRQPRGGPEKSRGKTVR